MLCPNCRSEQLQRVSVKGVVALACKGSKCLKKRSLVPRFFTPGKDGALVPATWIEDAWKQQDQRQQRIDHG